MTNCHIYVGYSMGKGFWDALQQKEVVPLGILAHFV